MGYELDLLVVGNRVLHKAAQDHHVKGGYSSAINSDVSKSPAGVLGNTFRWSAYALQAIFLYQPQTKEAYVAWSANDHELCGNHLRW
jgi:hypothetical protein